MGSVLREAGFSETDFAAGLDRPAGRRPDRPARAQSVAATPVAAPSARWKRPRKNRGSFSPTPPDSATNLAARLRAAGARCRVARPRRTISPRRRPTPSPCARKRRRIGRQLLEACADDAPLERIVYLWNLDAQIDDDAVDGHRRFAAPHPGARSDAARRRNCGSIRSRAAPSRRAATPSPTAVAQAPAIGLFRVILNEHPNFACRGIDLPPAASDGRCDACSGANCCAQTRSAKSPSAAKRATSSASTAAGRRVEQSLDPAVPLRLESRERGHLDTLRFAPFALPPCGPGEVLIEVKAAGMNFRDVLKALALYPGEAPGRAHLRRRSRRHRQGRRRGRDARRAGRSRVRPRRLRPCDPDARARRRCAPHSGGSVVRGSGDAARGLHDFVACAEKRGAAAQGRDASSSTRARAASAWRRSRSRIISARKSSPAAGSPTKRALLKTLGVKHVIDSRRGDFAEAVMELTDRRGVDVVLNALAGEAIPMGLSCLAEFGRFIEIGKRDIYQNSRIPLWPLRRNASFHVVAMDAVFSGDEALTREMLASLPNWSRKARSRRCPSAPSRRAASMRRSGSWRAASISAKSSCRSRRRLCRGAANRSHRRSTIKPDGCYLITGAFGGFGKVLAEVAGGMRRAAPRAHAAAAARRHRKRKPSSQSLRDRGVNVQVVRADVGSAEDVARLLAEIRAGDQPLRGVFHLAMVIDDAPLAALNRERMRDRDGAKGAWRLAAARRHTAISPLDCFVMFSSVSSIFGNPAQGNYGAANAFLDSLAHHRRALGLPALTMNWGVLGGEGYVARNERVAEFLARQGTTELSPGEVMSIARIVASSPATRRSRRSASTGRSGGNSSAGMQENPLLERIFAAVEGQESGGVDERLAAQDRVRRAGRKAKPSSPQAVREVVGSVLRVKPDSLRDDQPLTDLGLDSLMGVEIENSLEAAIGVALPPTSLMRARTIGQIATLIAGHVGGTAPATATTPANGSMPVAEPATSTVEVDLDALSD